MIMKLSGKIGKLGVVVTALTVVGVMASGRTMMADATGSKTYIMTTNTVITVPEGVVTIPKDTAVTVTATINGTLINKVGGVTFEVTGSGTVTVPISIAVVALCALATPDVAFANGIGAAGPTAPTMVISLPPGSENAGGARAGATSTTPVGKASIATNF